MDAMSPRARIFLLVAGAAALAAGIVVVGVLATRSDVPTVKPRPGSPPLALDLGIRARSGGASAQKCRDALRPRPAGRARGGDFPSLRLARGAGGRGDRGLAGRNRRPAAGARLAASAERARRVPPRARPLLGAPRRRGRAGLARCREARARLALRRARGRLPAPGLRAGTADSSSRPSSRRCGSASCRPRRSSTHSPAPPGEAAPTRRSCTASPCSGSTARAPPERQFARRRAGGAERSGGAGGRCRRPLRQGQPVRRLLPARPAGARLPARPDGPVPPRPAPALDRRGEAGPRRAEIARSEDPKSTLGQQAADYLNVLAKAGTE